MLGESNNRIETQDGFVLRQYSGHVIFVTLRALSETDRALCGASVLLHMDQGCRLWYYGLGLPSILRMWDPPSWRQCTKFTETLLLEFFCRYSRRLVSEFYLGFYGTQFSYPLTFPNRSLGHHSYFPLTNVPGILVALIVKRFQLSRVLTL